MFQRAPSPASQTVAAPADAGMVSPRLGVASYEERKISPGTASGYLSHAENPGHFYIQLTAVEKKFKNKSEF